MAFAVNALVETNGELTEKLSNNHALTADFADRSEKLLELLRLAGVEVNEQLPNAFDEMQLKLDNNRQTLTDVKTLIDTNNDQCEQLKVRIADIDTLLSAQATAISAIGIDADGGLNAQREQVNTLTISLAEARKQIDGVIEVANTRLVASMQEVEETTRQTAVASKAIIDTELTSIADSLTQKNSHSLKIAVDEQIRLLDTAMHESLQRNLSFADEVEKRTASQLSRIDEMATNLEQRVVQTHGSFAGLDDEGFARKMALLTESLNSAAIDVAKLLSNEVTDTAWAAYLKGDRGVFTRRAVRLLDSAEVKVIAASYDDDSEFRENVNRYIHDFEAMMRVLLSTRDGNAIGVTLLSSDVGKLYVALAQAIERLRN